MAAIQSFKCSFVVLDIPNAIYHRLTLALFQQSRDSRQLLTMHDEVISDPSAPQASSLQAAQKHYSKHPHT